MNINNYILMGDHLNAFYVSVYIILSTWNFFKKI
jgi:hypothetical protein